MEDEHEHYHHSSPKTKFNYFVASLCSSCCFRSSSSRRELSAVDDDVDDVNVKPRLIKASSSWLRSRAHEFPEFKEKCRNLFCRIGKSRHRHRHHNSADFRYDPLSYALNFDDGANPDVVDAFADDRDQFDRNSRNFSARLPQSPPPPPLQQKAAVVPSEITVS
ncbi:hypothetical protein Scep_008303 [Stephania cephalantha]|uniref:Uncharacterized protein n=1 Tax=Stephania cephalantha TaxID=152367 RepID=A0AAP0PQU0_9MAGN